MGSPWSGGQSFQLSLCTLQEYIDSSDCAAQNSQKSVIMKTSCLDYSILPKANGLKNFSVLKNVSLPRSMNNELFTRAKTFHQLYTAVDHDRITSQLIMTTRYIVPGCLILIFNEMLLR